MLGESGSGKTTLLRALAGLDDDAETQGSFTKPDSRSVLFQDSRLLPWKTVIDNVTLGLRRPDARSAAADILGLVGLADKVDVWSGARAVARRRAFRALDALTRLRMQNLLLKLVERRRPTIILVTHDVDEALLLSDRIFVLKDGGIAEDHLVSLWHPRRNHQSEISTLRAKLLKSLGVEADTV